MAGITLDIAQTKLQLWLDADAKVANNQEAWVEGRRVTRADARTITKNITYWNTWVVKLSRASRRRSRNVYVVGSGR